MGQAPSRRAQLGVPLVVLLVAAFVRLWGLGTPATMYWYEQYYVFDAEVYIGGGIGQPIAGEPPVKIADEGTWVHPPLGKWLIALLGVGPLGLRAIGWRLPSAILGIAGVALLYLLAFRLWRPPWWAAWPHCCWASTVSTSSRAAWRCSTSSSRPSSPQVCCSWCSIGSACDPSTYRADGPGSCGSSDPPIASGLG